MEEQGKYNKTNDDEFDIEVFFYKIYLILMKVFSKILLPFRILFSKPGLLIINLLVAAGIAFLLKMVMPPVYESSFIIKPLNTNEKYYINLIWDLETLIHNHDYEILARELNISEDIAKQYNHIHLYSAKRSKYSDTVESATVTIRTKDNRLFDTLQYATLAYLENNQHYKRIKSLRLQEISKMREKIGRDILELDSLKKQLMQNVQPRNAGGFVYGSPIDPSGVYQESLNLYRQQISLDWQTQYTDNFELVKKCVSSKKPYAPKFMRLFMILGGVAIVITFIVNLRRQRKGL